MQHVLPSNWGRPPNKVFDLYATYPIHQRPATKDSFADGVRHTQRSIVTGTSVFAIKYKDGMMTAADNLAEPYGTLTHFREIKRLHPAIQSLFDEVVTDGFTHQDRRDLGSSEVHRYLSCIMYNFILVSSSHIRKQLVGPYSLLSIATGYGVYIAVPLLREAVDGQEDTLSEADARALIHNCMRVLRVFYRDARSLDKCQLATIQIETQWTPLRAPLPLPTCAGFPKARRQQPYSNQRVALFLSEQANRRPVH
ncbi:hypothetical protein C2E23DRAFT_866791 [Lenzites betulinus]|nr:hypothetical protein C2E23DRAFT_866791 [Lenzites betulinus]